jgi:hypothetical protein
VELFTVRKSSEITVDSYRCELSLVRSYPLRLMLLILAAVTALSGTGPCAEVPCWRGFSIRGFRIFRNKWLFWNFRILWYKWNLRLLGSQRNLWIFRNFWV